MFRIKRMLVVFAIAALMLSACQPLLVEPTTQQADEAAMAVIDQFFAAYRDNDLDALLALHTDDAVWTWIDPGKNFPDLGPEGKLAASGKEAIQGLFEYDQNIGFNGYVVWSDVVGNRVMTTELWGNSWTDEIDAPLVTKSIYTLRDGKIAGWEWMVSPESSWRFMNTPSTLEANRQLMASITEEIFNQGNLDLIDTLYAADYVRHEAGYPDALQGSAGLKQFIAALRAGFPDWTCTTPEMLAAGDKVAVRYVCTGTQTGEWNGIPPTGKTVTLDDTIIHTIIDGKVVEDWSNYDSLGFMQQLGFELVPAQQ